MPYTHDLAASWDYGPIDAARLQTRGTFYAKAAGAGKELRGKEAAAKCDEGEKRTVLLLAASGISSIHVTDGPCMHVHIHCHVCRNS